MWMRRLRGSPRNGLRPRERGGGLDDERGSIKLLKHAFAQQDSEHADGARLSVALESHR